DGVAADLARAMRIARHGRPGPVHLSLPVDVLEAKLAAARSAGNVPGSATGGGTGGGTDGGEDRGEPALSAGDAESIVARLRGAARPLILTGPASMGRAARERCARLAHACGVPVVGMQSPRGINDPALGAFAEMLAQAD